ncbi:MAG: serine/threonine protein kinase [Cuspidothrix sp.]
MLYQAQHTLLNQWVVIKTPNERLQNHPEYPEFVKRFIEEGRKLAELSKQQHPNIVRISDLFQEGNLYCLIMDFVAGESLLNLVERRGALPAAEAIGYIQQIGEALIVVHQAGLVHRDAHPGNIMIQKNGKAILIDFGIAADIQGHYTSMHPAHRGFAPYEQSRGHKKPTVDIYTLAASLYYTVTARYPESSFDRKLNDIPLIPPRKYVSISDDLNRAILKGMELEPQNRPQSMEAWLNLLGNLNGLGVVNNSSSFNNQNRYNRYQSIPWFSLGFIIIYYSFFGFLSAFDNVAWVWVSTLLFCLPAPWGWAIAFVVFMCASLWASHPNADPKSLAFFWAWASVTSSAWASGWVYSRSLLSTLTVATFICFAIVAVLAFGWNTLFSYFYFCVIHCVLFTLYILVTAKFNKLSSQKFKFFLISSITSSIGLFLGWLVHQIFPIFANR